MFLPELQLLGEKYLVQNFGSKYVTFTSFAIPPADIRYYAGCHLSVPDSRPPDIGGVQNVRFLRQGACLIA